jgi:hypothetical protein
MRKIYDALFGTETRLLWTIFSAHFLVRLAFIVFSGFDNFQLQPDTLRYDRQSSAILAGNFNLAEPLFITAPLYPYLEAGFKLIFAGVWMKALEIFQLLGASLSGVYIYKIAKLVWSRQDVALIAAAIYCVYPFTFWWVNTFAQDMMFQCLLIFSIYFLLKAAFEERLSDLVKFSVLFSLTFLTKSHVLLFAPFAALFLLLNSRGTLVQRISRPAIVAAICFAFTLPYGLYNLKANGVYVISSSGQGGFFLSGHNDDIYAAVVSPPPRGTPEWQRLLNFEYDVFQRLTPKKDEVSQSELQRIYFEEGLRWCRENPGKLLTLIAYDLYFFLKPGLNPNWYPVKPWLASLVISAPIYLLAYAAMFAAFRSDWRRHLWMLGLFLSMVGFSTIFYVQNRFRTITVEPYYIVYAAYPLAGLLAILRSRFLPAARVVASDEAELPV